MVSLTGPRALVGRPADAAALRGELAYRGMAIGLYGGSFNPAHAGHAHVAHVALTRLGLDRVWWLVSPQNPLKGALETAAYDRRLQGARTFADHPRMVVSDLEARAGVRFTADTIAAALARWPGVRFVWIMGGDNLASFHRWADWEKIFQAVPIAVIARPGFTMKALLSPAARRFADARAPEFAARRLAWMEPPAWVHLSAPLSHWRSTDLRTAERGRPGGDRAC